MLCILFFPKALALAKVIYKFMEWLLHVELIFMALSLNWMNWLITLVVSDKQNGEKVVTISCKSAVFDLLCFINLTK